MIDSQYIFPATLSALTILATVLNFTAHFSNGEYLSWKAFNRISLATLLSMTVCIFAWMIHSRAGMLSSLQLVENNLGNMALILLGSMFVVYQEFILFKNVLSWIGRKAVPMDLSYSLYAILVPLVVMIIKIPFSSPLDMFPKNNIWGSTMFRLRLLALYDGTFTGICRYYGCHSIHPVRYRTTAER